MGARLIALKGPLEHTVVELDAVAAPTNGWYAGREPTNPIELPDIQVSRVHALFRKTGDDDWEVEDLDSKNGTWVNGQRVTRHLLAAGDQIQIGETRFLFLAGSAEGPGQVSIDPEQWGFAPTLQLPDGESWARRPQLAASGSRNYLPALVHLATELQNQPGVEGVQRELLRRVFDLVPAERGAVLVIDPESSEIGATYGWRRNDGSAQITLSKSVLSQVRREKSALLGRFQQGASTEPPSVLSAGIDTLIAAPMVVRDRVVGVLYLDTTDRAQPLREEHLQLAAAMAAMTAQPLESALRIEHLEAEKRRLEDDLGRGFEMIGDSPAMQKVYQALLRIAASDSTVLITGETGSGKELAARAIHNRGRRAKGPFVAINCAAIAENLLESELFGHERGAFTGAVAQKRGKIEMAENGTLFLDEIGELSLALQAKLLRVLQERELERVGGTRPIPVNVRVVAATNRDLAEMVAQGHFRSDLYYRVNVVALRLPALRERGDDTLLLTTYFLQRLAKDAPRIVKGLSPQARAAIRSYDWPGNVRELQNALERAVVLGSGEWIEVEDLPQEIVEASPELSSQGAGGYHAAVLDAKRRILRAAMEEAGGSFTGAAHELGINVKYLHRLLRAYGLKDEAR
jgi:Nif-specific regulatory protein